MSFSFSPDLIAFLHELVENNDRDWFKANQARYEAQVREPARAFIREMRPILAEHAPALFADDRKVGGSMMRPQRDTRFGHDKTPYKTHVGIQFRHQAGKDVHAPGFYVHLGPDEVFVGLGMWRPASPDLKAIRGRIDQEPERWRDIVSDPDLLEHWTISDEDRLKRNPRGYDKDHPMGEWLRYKSHILVHHPDPELPFREDFVETLVELLDRGRRHAAFLCDALGQPW